MLIVILQIVDLLKCLVITMGSLLNVSHQRLMLNVQPPVFLEVVNSVSLEKRLLLGEHQGSGDLDR